MKSSLLFISTATAFEDIVAHVNSLGSTWTAKVPKFEDLDVVKKLLGTDVHEHNRLVDALPEGERLNVEVPDDFDVRTNWPSCAAVTGDIRDQSDCGSCWAHGSTESFNDRYCIATGSTVLLSTEDALANSGAGSCNGGQPTSVLNWIHKTGIVTGGDYTDIGKGTTCAPYSLPTCQHHNWKPPTPEHPACPDEMYPTPASFSTCKENSYPTTFKDDKVKGGSAYSIKGEANIQADIAQYGSVSAVMYVYADLPAYESGVYEHVSGSFLGGHAVAMIGWGVENGTPYWLIKNSWNTDWGADGLFKIKRGANECGIESGISASKPEGIVEQTKFQEIAERVNSLGSTWKAQAPSRFASVEDVKPYLGTILKGEAGFKATDKEVTEVPNIEIPAEFDVRTAFPDCASVSGNIRDQSSCGSCWAFGSTEAFNDRHCIATGSTVKLSVEDTTANCGFSDCFSMGCGGGQPGQAWNWFKSKGVVTGGDYDDIGAGDSCGPYSLAPCAHHVPATEKYPACPSSEYSTPTLKECTESAYGKTYRDDKIKATDSYSLNGISAIQADMVQYGSATAAFTVYDDFPTYKSGVYKKTSSKALGGHAVKLLGWGTENGEDYWLVANSWNEQWGDNGTFKIARGNNECGIEGQVHAGRAGSSEIIA